MESYKNVIPIGDRCITVWGGEVLYIEDIEAHASFIDHKGQVLFAARDGIYTLNGSAAENSDFRVLFRKDPALGENNVGNPGCEILESPIAENERGDGYIFIRTNDDYADDGDRSMILYVLNDLSENPSIKRFYQPNQEKDGKINEINITCMVWYDNRLLVYEKLRGTLWISRTDPTWCLRETDGEIPSRWSGGADLLWANWLKSSFTAESINKLLVYQGLLYAFYNNSIEVFSRTGNEDAPLQYVENMNVPGIGAIDAAIVSDRIFLLASNSGLRQIMVISKNSFPTKISNFEIDRLLEKHMPTKIQNIRIQGFNFPAVNLYENTFLCCNQAGESNLWFFYSLESFENPLGSNHKLASLKNVANNIQMMGDKASRLTAIIFNSPNSNAIYSMDGEGAGQTKRIAFLMSREIKDFPMDFPKRVILRSVEIVCDTGRITDDLFYLTDEKNKTPYVYLRVSTDNGHSWGNTYKRLLGERGQNDKQIVFRNLGSGKNFLFQFGSSALQSFQIYKLRVEVA
jgi:hypothetical protein